MALAYIFAALAGLSLLAAAPAWLQVAGRDGQARIAALGRAASITGVGLGCLAIALLAAVAVRIGF